MFDLADSGGDPVQAAVTPFAAEERRQALARYISAESKYHDQEVKRPQMYGSPPAAVQNTLGKVNAFESKRDGPVQYPNGGQQQSTMQFMVSVPLSENPAILSLDTSGPPAYMDMDDMKSENPGSPPYDFDAPPPPPPGSPPPGGPPPGPAPLPPLPGGLQNPSTNAIWPNSLTPTASSNAHGQTWPGWDPHRHQNVDVQQRVVRDYAAAGRPSKGGSEKSDKLFQEFSHFLKSKSKEAEGFRRYLKEKEMDKKKGKSKKKKKKMKAHGSKGKSKSKSRVK